MQSVGVWVSFSPFDFCQGFFGFLQQQTIGKRRGLYIILLVFSHGSCHFIIDHLVVVIRIQS